MKTPHPQTPKAGILVLSLAALLLTRCTVEQIMIGQFYTIRTPQAGGCPNLNWRFFVNPQHSLFGTLLDDRQQPIAGLSGVLDPDDSFRITATATSGDRTATITGRFTSEVSTLSIQGDAAGAACNGQTFQLRLSGYFARQGGGGGGGG
jgi:hypothetical protein